MAATVECNFLLFKQPLLLLV